MKVDRCIKSAGNVYPFGRFRDVVVNHDLSDPNNLPQEKTRPNPAVVNLKVVREHYKDALGLQARTPQSIRSVKEMSRHPLRQSLTLPPISRCKTELDGFLTARRRPKSPTPNYTMINKRVPTGERQRAVDFKALNSTFKRIPSLFDRPHDENVFPKKDMEIWKNEVKKVVPGRPSYAIKSDWQAPPAEWDDRDQFIYGPKSVFYKNLKYVEKQDFTINPEWLSEHMAVSTMSTAYRTCALRYGWCA